MTRQAAREGFDFFVEDVIEIAYEEFDVVGAIRQGARGGSSKAISAVIKRSDALDTHVVQPLLDEHRQQIMEQFEHVLDYAEAENAAFDEYAADVLDADMYFESLKSEISRDRQADIERTLLERQKGLGDAIEPLVRADESEFWPAVTATFTRSEAAEFVKTQFAFTAPLDEHQDAFAFQTTIDPSDVVGGPLALGLPSLSVDYTDEAVRTMQTAESQVIDQTVDLLEEKYD